jgi:hypothetical protein
LTVKDRVLPFSFFPVTRGNRRYGLFDVLFAVSPWAIMQGAINDQVRDEGERAEALAFLEQAQDFYEAAADRMAANPLLYYYAFVNLGKALLRTRGFPGSLDQAMHGLSERRTGSGKELANSIAVVQDSRRDVVNIYSELIERLGFDRPADGDTYEIPFLLPQVVVGHRLWKEAARRSERFLSLSEIEIVSDPAAKELWLRLYLPRGDLRRYDITHKRLLEESALSDLYREVDVAPTGRDPSLICFEQLAATPYSGRPTDVVQDVVDDTRHYLWRIVSSRPTDGYRRYYLLLSPPNEQPHRIPQIASLWALFFYFGSVVRYRPQMFDAMSEGDFGAVVTEFVSAQPGQLLYLLASEMCRREVAKPAIV